MTDDWVLTIREATIADASAIAGLMTELGYPTQDSEMRARFTAIEADATYRTFVAQVASAVAGVAGVGLSPYYERNGIYGRILVLAVSEAHRGHGVGRALVAASEAWAVSRGAHAMLVNTAHHREHAHRFYTGIGYGSTGLRFVKELAGS